jgi:putative solute:sodium symporter small subunit
MSDPVDDPPASVFHWHHVRRTAIWLTLAWAVVTFAPPFFARELDFDIWGAPAGVWIAAQLGPLVYVMLVWLYERRASRLDRLSAAQRAD